MEVKLDSAAVEQAVAQAIVESAIGAKIKVAVNHLLTKGWDNPIDKALEQVIAEVSLKTIREEYGEQIKAEVRKRLEEDTLAEFVKRFWQKVLSIKYD